MAKSDLPMKISLTLSEIYERDGEIRASALIAEARPKDSSIHEAFEWNNSTAADEYRLMQARTWIRRIKITFEDREEILVHIPHFIRVGEEGAEEDNEGCYKPMSIVARNVDEYHLALKQTVTRLSSARAAYEDLKKAFKQAEAETEKGIDRIPDFVKADRGFRQIEKAFNPVNAPATV
jgi:hypothetical protein